MKELDLPLAVKKYEKNLLPYDWIGTNDFYGNISMNNNNNNNNDGTFTLDAEKLCIELKGAPCIDWQNESGNTSSKKNGVPFKVERALLKNSIQ